MKLKPLAAVCLAGFTTFCAQSALANHIDPNLGIDVSLYSSDGAGNFTLKIDEYMSAYGELWVGDVSGPGAIGAWDATSTSPNLLISLSGASTSGPSTATLNYQGIVDSSKAMFSTSSTQWAVNFDGDGWATDAGKYSQLVSYSIADYNPNQTYSLTATVTDCCTDVPPPDLLSVQSQLTFNPAVAAVPVPAAFWLLGSGLLGMFGFTRKQQLISAA